MRPSLKFGLFFILAAGLVACDSMELTIAVNKLEDRSLEVVNTNDRVLKEVPISRRESEMQ